MRFIQYLQEEYLSTFPGIGQTQYTVYKNPSSSDIVKLRKEISEVDKSYSVRGLVDLSDKDIYLFPAVLDLHDMAYDKLKKSKQLSTPETNMLNFIGYIDSGKIFGETLHPLSGRYIPKDIKFDWLKPFIKNIDSIKIDNLRNSAIFA